MKIVLVHVHMFKHAGSTFDWILRKNFGDDFLDDAKDYDSNDMIEQGEVFLKTLIIKNPDVRAISGHHVWFNPALIRLDNIKIIPVYILRHPIERVLSVYLFEKKQGEAGLVNPGAQHAKKLSFDDYVNWRLSKKPFKALSNANIRYCTGISSPNGINSASLSEAKSNLKNTMMMGVVDRFDESMTVFEQELRQYFSFFNADYVSKNVTSSRFHLTKKSRRWSLFCYRKPWRDYIRQTGWI